MLGPNYSLLGALGGAIGGFFTGGPVGAVLGGIGGALGGSSNPITPSGTPGGSQVTSGYAPVIPFSSGQIPGIQIGGKTINPGNILPGGQPFIQPTRTTMVAPGVCSARGYHPVKQHGKYGAAGTYCVRNRHLNPLNPRALKRALRRAHGFEKFARRVMTAQYFTAHSPHKKHKFKTTHRRARA